VRLGFHGLVQQREILLPGQALAPGLLLVQVQLILGELLVGDLVLQFLYFLQFQVIITLLLFEYLLVSLRGYFTLSLLQRSRLLDIDLHPLEVSFQLPFLCQIILGRDPRQLVLLLLYVMEFLTLGLDALDFHQLVLQHAHFLAVLLLLLLLLALDLAHTSLTLVVKYQIKHDARPTPSHLGILAVHFISTSPSDLQLGLALLFLLLAPFDLQQSLPIHLASHCIVFLGFLSMNF